MLTYVGWRFGNQFTRPFATLEALIEDAAGDWEGGYAAADRVLAG